MANEVAAIEARPQKDRRPNVSEVSLYEEVQAFEEWDMYLTAQDFESDVSHDELDDTVQQVVEKDDATKRNVAGIPQAIVFPQLRTTLVQSLNKSVEMWSIGRPTLH